MEGLDKKLPGLHLLEVDVRSDQSVADAVRAVIDKHGRIDILINNAGVPCVGPLAELPLSVLHSTFDTNVYGLMRVIKAVVPHMISRAKGKIVNVGSVAALAPVPWGGAYNASKAAVHALSDCLRVELKPFGIDVITVAPGAIKSNIGSNCSTLYKNNPEWKFYKPFEKAIYGIAEFSQQPGFTSTEVFANKTVDAILRRKPPAWFSYGKYSTVSAFLYYLPLWIKDAIMRKLFVVSSIENAKEK
jgi:NAD(P)-dependent dehydrogenase (short-subunit alcohol dehydrogenase family)